MPDFGEAGASDQANVTRSDEGELHGLAVGLNGAAGAVEDEAAGSFVFNSMARSPASDPSDPLGLLRMISS
jgi:hypothetical protein